MTSRFKQVDLQFRVPFVISSGIRTSTRALFLELNLNGITGYGEACFPPYVSENADDSKKQLEKILSGKFNPEFSSRQNISALADQFHLPSYTRTVLTNALFDLHSKIHQRSLASVFHLENKKNYKTTITITRSDLKDLRTKKLMAEPFSHLKLKLNGDNDQKFVEEVLTSIHRPFCVDVNQGWESKSEEDVNSILQYLKSVSCELVEQPFHKENHDRHHFWNSKNILPIIADEGIQNERDYQLYGNCYAGVNVKLLECGGIDRAYSILQQIKTDQKITIVGCMSESTCGCSAAIQLGELADYLDTDGPFLIKNDPFDGLQLKNGKFETVSTVGIGTFCKPEFFTS